VVTWAKVDMTLSQVAQALLPQPHVSSVTRSPLELLVERVEFDVVKFSDLTVITKCLRAIVERHAHVPCSAVTFREVANGGGDGAEHGGFDGVLLTQSTLDSIYTSSKESWAVSRAHVRCNANWSRGGGGG
jgi:hypothetical protein